VPGLDFEKFKETYINKLPDQKPKRVIFDKNQINENLKTSFKSLVGFFSTKNDGPKQTEENRLLDREWSLLCQGQSIAGESQEQNMLKLLENESNRKFFLNHISRTQPINLNELTEEQYSKLQDSGKNIFQFILTEVNFEIKRTFDKLIKVMGEERF